MINPNKSCQHGNLLREFCIDCSDESKDQISNVQHIKSVEIPVDLEKVSGENMNDLKKDLLKQKADLERQLADLDKKSRPGMISDEEINWNELKAMVIDIMDEFEDQGYSKDHEVYITESVLKILYGKEIFDWMDSRKEE